MLDDEQLDAQWREGLRALATQIEATVPNGAPERVEAVGRRARRRVFFRTATSAVALAAIIAAVVALTLGRDTTTRVGVTPATEPTSTTAACQPILSRVIVYARANLKFDESTYRAHAGCVQIVYFGPSGHTLRFDPPGPTGPTLHSLKPSTDETDTSDSEGPSSDVWRFTPGSYTFSCEIPGHRQAGMQAVLVVD